MGNLYLALPLEWLLSGPWWWVLAKCWLVTPGIPQVLGLVFESRWVPWSPRYQFVSFIPGDFFLGIFIALAATFVPWLPPGTLSSSAIMAYILLAITFIAYVALNLMDAGSNYTREQMLSAEKIYHNLLYWWYGYVGVTMLILLINIEGIGWLPRILVVAFGLVWVGLLVAENFASEETKARRFKYAHSNNMPIWRNGWRLRRWTPTGYR